MNNKMFSPITLNELTAVIQHSVAQALLNPESFRLPAGKDRKIIGIKGLAEFLQCSEPTAVKAGKSGKFPKYQEGRKIFFYESEVLSGLSK